MTTYLSLADLLDLDDELGWQQNALCAQVDGEIFFPEKGGSTADAKQVCGLCDVRAECLEYAMANEERFGIWGGLSERERRKLKPPPADETGWLKRPRVERDTEILRLSATGASDQWIGEQVGVTALTVRRARARNTNTQAAA